MKSKLFLICLFCLLFGGACNNRQEERAAKIVDLKESSRIRPLSTEFFRLEIPEEIKIGCVDQFESDGSRIYLLQSNSSHRGLYAFDMRGTFAGKVGDFGRGAGEYRQPLSFALTEKHILILDTSGNFVLRYRKDDLTFEDKSKIFNTSYFESIDDDTFVCGNDEYESQKPYCEKQYVLTDASFRPQSGYVDKIVLSGYETGPNRPMYRFENRPRTYTQYYPYVYECTSEGVVPVYEIRFGDFRLPSAEFLRQICADDRDYYDDLTDSGFISYYSVYETSDQLQIDFFVSHKKKIGFYSKSAADGFFAAKEAWERDYPFATWTTVGTWDDRFVSALFVSDLREREGEIEMPAELKALMDKCSDNDLILWRFKLSDR